MVAGLGKALGSALSKGLAKNIGSSTAKLARTSATKKSLESGRQGSIIEAQKKEKQIRAKALKKAAMEARKKHQNTFTFQGKRYVTANH